MILIKVRESDFVFEFEKEYSHVSQGGFTTLAYQVYASATSLLLTFGTDHSSWSPDTDYDFIVMQVDLTGANVLAAFGFGSNTG